MTVIHIDRLNIVFPLYHERRKRLRRLVAKPRSQRLVTDRHRRTFVHALRDVSFSLHPGERLGLIGHNGAGKTTLLRAMAGIYEPVSGRAYIAGHLNALLESGMGMNMDLSGRENIQIRCLYEGMKKPEIQAVEKDVLEFADLGSFIDMPVRTYSSGMLVRLAFALATSIRPQIILMDEWLMAGDESFIKKAKNRLVEVLHGADILVVSTHQNEIIRQWCNRVIWMENGRIRMDGAPDEVLEAYTAG